MLVSCSSQNDADTKSIAQPLIERSLELDVILYGKGLCVSEEEKNGKYSKVTDAELTSIDKIRDACAEVSTGELCEIIENSVLRGKTGDEGISYAKFIELSGVLYQYDEAKVYITYPRKYDFDSIKTRNATDKRIIFSIDTYPANEDGSYSEKAERLELKLLWDDAQEGWRLDTPTF